jgi:Uma2 family endonuclease
VLSPATRRADTGDKRDLYQRKGVPEYWVVDVENRIVDRWLPSDASPETVADTIVWHPDAMAPALSIDLRAYFARLASIGA